ncbi:hypothetical protein ACLE20_05895 [Rhizobium sp. YIM 134829]|uniref:hypothetical protein n=1 Tax=Rhizobium sp. YIM 134829 TaxID=3390453 RepID=UPI00397BEF6C
MFTIRKMATIGLIALTVTGSTLALSTDAEAHNNFGAGLATGLAGGALLGGAFASAPPTRTVVYGPPVYAEPVYGAPVYATPAYGAPVYAPYVHCHTAWHQNHYGQFYQVRACAD